jgi:hypothetical protein
VKDVGAPVKFAVTEVSLARVTTHDVVPLHAPDQPLNVDPAVGVAVRVTAVPLEKLALHVVPQLMPAGLLVTEPVPVPARVTLRTGAAPRRLNVAVTEVLLFSVTAQTVIPLQVPDQPAKIEPTAGVAVKVTGDPGE